MPEVSVIVPNYNHARFLRQRIDSVLAQTFTDFELIILDDCSTDNSRDVIESYRQHPRVTHIVYNEQNSGSTFKQWEKGIGLAAGNLIWIAESDDYADPELLEVLAGICVKDTSVVLACCGSNLADADGQIIGKAVRGMTEAGQMYVNNSADECRLVFFLQPAIPNASAVVFRKERFYTVDESFREYKICGDWQFWADVCFDWKGKFVYFPQCLNYFRQAGNSVSRGGSLERYKLFLHEKLQVAMHINKKSGQTIGGLTKWKFLNDYLFTILLETSRQKMYTASEVIVIIGRLCRLSLLTLVMVWVVLFRVVLTAISKLGKLFFKKIKDRGYGIMIT